MPARNPRRRSETSLWPHGGRLDVVAIGASAGGLTALAKVLQALAPGFQSSIMIVQHLDPKRKSHLPMLLQKYSGLRVKQAVHGEVIMPGTVYVAPPDEHMLVGPGKIQLAHSQLIHFSRPSIDLMFESVAGTYGSRSAGVVLSGTLSDGAAGIRAIKEAGGLTIAQDPLSAEFKSMPSAAIATGCVDFILPLGKIGEKLNKLH